MTDTKRIPIEEADLATLKAFAELTLGIEVKTGTNAKQLRGQIQQAMPGVTDVPALAEKPVSTWGDPMAKPDMQAAAARRAAEHAAKVEEAARNYSIHLPQNDPKVTVEFHRTADKSRAPDVTIGCDGYVCRYQRGKRVDIPYRIYLVAKDAIEKQAVDTDEINPITNLPYKEWVDVPSYPMMVHAMPSAEEIAAWHAVVDGQEAAPVRAAA